MRKRSSLFDVATAVCGALNTPQVNAYFNQLPSRPGVFSPDDAFLLNAANHCKHCQRQLWNHPNRHCLFESTSFEPMPLADFCILTLKRLGASEETIQQFIDHIRGTSDHNG